MSDVKDKPHVSAARLLKAAPHQFGPGKVHLLDGDEQTFCGQKLRFCPGTVIDGEASLVTCKKCLQVAEIRSERAVRTEQYQKEAEQREREREEADRQWWAWYGRYLGSDTWKHKRRLVLKRAGGICEGCRERPATEIHHLTYKRCGDEMLFDLVALCSRCHNQITEQDRAERQRDGYYCAN